MITLEGLTSRAFLLRIRPGCIAEYRRRHHEIWPEMIAALRASGCMHYDIYVHEPSHSVFGHMLYAPTATGGAEDPTILRWRAYMADVLEMDADQPRREPLEQVFMLRP